MDKILLKTEERREERRMEKDWTIRKNKHAPDSGSKPQHCKKEQVQIFYCTVG
jgi:hypothetical protein